MLAYDRGENAILETLVRDLYNIGDEQSCTVIHSFENDALLPDSNCLCVVVAQLERVGSIDINT